MKSDEKIPPESMLAPAIAAAGAKLSVRDGRVEILFAQAQLRVRMHGRTFSALEKPAVIVGGKKIGVDAIY